MVARVLARGAAAESHLAAAAPAMPQPAAAPAAPQSAAPQPDAAPAAPQPVTATPQPDAAPAEPAPVAERGSQPHDETPAPAAPAEPREAPAGPVTLERIEHAWPDILVMLEGIDRTSWLVATTARVADFAGDVLTLSFGSATDVAKFKKLQAGKGPSEDLRQAIQTVLGVRVKYIARHGGGPAGPAGGHGDGPAPPDDDPAPDPAPQVAAADPASAPRTAPPAGAQPAAPVTDWAVVAIPQGSPSDESPAALAVDDEPEDAASAAIRTATLAPPREGDVLPARDVQTSAAPDEDDPDETDLDIADVPVVATPLPASSVRGGGVERVGEAVVRQILGARFVREEPYESPTRFQ
jgi:DNA polymerase-3 subunit gamma/tau